MSKRIVCKTIEDAFKKWPEQDIKTCNDLTGQQFGRLVVLYRTTNTSDRRVAWVCQCCCSEQNFVKVSARNLLGGNTKSCGCLKKEHLQNIGYKNAKDYTGIRIGQLTFIEPTQKRCGEAVVWKLKHDDGRILEATYGNVFSKNFTGSNSSGAIKLITSILIDLGIKFEKEKCFKECINPQTGHNLRFDFYLPDYNCCIEYDGEQHFKETGFFDPLEKIRYRDNIKNQYCKNNNIKLIRIPYVDYFKINKQFILDKVM